MPEVPVFSEADRLAPYLDYRVVCSLDIDAGSVAVPLAYKARLQGQAVKPTTRILQLAQPGSVITVEWYGKRLGTKPQPPIITASGSFVLARAGGACGNPVVSANGREIVTASGYLLLYTTVQAADIELPSLFAPWAGEYGTVREAYAYTPVELGFGALLPGQLQPVTLKEIINNPPAQQNNARLFTI